MRDRPLQAFALLFVAPVDPFGGKRYVARGSAPFHKVRQGAVRFSAAAQYRPDVNQVDKQVRVRRSVGGGGIEHLGRFKIPFYV